MEHARWFNTCGYVTLVKGEQFVKQAIVQQTALNTVINEEIITISLEEENRRLKEARQCKICMDSEACVVFLPCGHLVTCVNCAPSLSDCPICRQAIKATVRTFLS
ncbi:hypothetical protein FOCC_FOCC003160 [Frankliniella occidentalis]|nr:hypothetical protein FOCC_FOCC003160 [Frankliniella occidentalis]